VVFCIYLHRKDRVSLLVTQALRKRLLPLLSQSFFFVNLPLPEEPGQGLHKILNIDSRSEKQGCFFLS